MPGQQLNLQDELSQVRDPANYIISNEVDGSDDDALSAALERMSHLSLYVRSSSRIPDVVEAVANSPDAVLEEDILDECRSLLK